MNDDSLNFYEKDDNSMTNSDASETPAVVPQYPNQPTQTRFFYRSSLKRSFDSSDSSDSYFSSDTDTSSSFYTKNESPITTNFGIVHNISLNSQNKTNEINSNKNKEEEKQEKIEKIPNEIQEIIPDIQMNDNEYQNVLTNNNWVLNLKNYYKNTESHKNIKWPTNLEIQKKLELLHNIKLHQYKPFLQRITQIVKKDRFFESRTQKIMDKLKPKLSIPSNNDKPNSKKHVKKSKPKIEKVTSSDTSCDSDIIFIDQKPRQDLTKSIPTEYEEIN